MTPAIPSLRSAALDAASVLMPVTCAGCGADDRSLCRNCSPAFVPVGFRQTLEDGHEDGLLVLSALRYDGVVRRAILNFKEEGRTDIAATLARPFAAAIAAAVANAAVANAAVANAVVPDAPAAAGQGGIELVTVPSNRASYRRRGYDPVAVLVRRAKLPPLARVLANTTRRGEQKALTADGRAANAVNSLRARRSLVGRRFLLIDDVITTGATLSEASRALRAAGGEVIGAATLAVTSKHTGVL